MIDKVFFQILNMSFASSFAIIFVLFARLILKKVPRYFLIPYGVLYCFDLFVQCPLKAPLAYCQ